MKKTKRIAAVATAAAFSVALLAGCGGTGTSGSNTQPESSAQSEATTATADGETIELTIWHTWGNGPGLDVMQQIVDRYNETNEKNIHVTLGYVANQASGNTQTMDKLMAAIAAGNPPEIALLDNFQVAGWAAQDALVPLDDLMAGVDLNLDNVYPFPIINSLSKSLKAISTYTSSIQNNFYALQNNS